MSKNSNYRKWMFLISLRHLTFLRTKTKAQSHFYFSSTSERKIQKKKWSLCVLLARAAQKNIWAEQQTALTKIKWRTKELFNPVVDFSLKRVEIASWMLSPLGHMKKKNMSACFNNQIVDHKRCTYSCKGFSCINKE